MPLSASAACCNRSLPQLACAACSHTHAVTCSHAHAVHIITFACRVLRQSGCAAGTSLLFCSLALLLAAHGLTNTPGCRNALVDADIRIWMLTYTHACACGCGRTTMRRWRATIWCWRVSTPRQWAYSDVRPGQNGGAVPRECKAGTRGDNTAFLVLWWISSLCVLSAHSPCLCALVGPSAAPTWCCSDVALLCPSAAAT